MPMSKPQIDNEWTKESAAHKIIDCSKKALELQDEYFGMINILKEGNYKRASDTIKNLVSDIKSHTLILQALLLEFDGEIPVEEDGVARALNDLRKAMKDTNEE